MSVEVPSIPLPLSLEPPKSTKSRWASPGEDVTYPFVAEIAAAMETGRSRSIVLSGNVQDLFYVKPKDAGRGKYVPLSQLLVDKFTYKNKVEIGGEDVNLAVLHLDLNDGIRFLNGCEGDIRNMFVTWAIGLQKTEHLPEPPAPATPRPTMRRATPPAPTKSPLDKKREEILATLDKQLLEARNNTGTALQILRRFVEASQTTNGPKLFIVIEGLDLLVPASDDIAKLPAATVKRLAILEDWFADADFLDGKSTVVMLADSYHAIHQRVTRLTQVVNIEVPAPDETARLKYIWWKTGEPKQDPNKLALDTGGLSLHAIRQLLVENPDGVSREAINRLLSEYIKSQLGKAVKFYKPNHRLEDVRGFSKLKQFARDEILPRLMTHDKTALAAIVVGGPIGVGKTFFWDAIAAEMDCPVLVLGELRSQWYGGTDIIIEKVRSIVHQLPKCIIMVDEADVALGGLSKGVHETEQRLTGSIQGMMSDPTLLGKVAWILMSARIERISADMRRPGRGGDLIIPMLDPQGEDRKEFVQWLLDVVTGYEPSFVKDLERATDRYSAALFAAVRKSAISIKNRRGLTPPSLLALVKDTLEPNIKVDRRYQELQSLLNCTRRSLLPDQYQDGDIGEYQRQWSEEIARLEPLISY